MKKSPTLKVSIGFIGAGNMAEALIKGILIKKLVDKEKVSAFEVNPARAKDMANRYGIRLTDSLPHLTQKTDILILCVKPQQMGEVLESLKPLIKNQLVITIAAGITTRFYLKKLGAKTRFIRVMPNMPAMLGFGATGIFAAKTATKTDLANTIALFAATGEVITVKREALIDAVTALSGSGPAFVYRFAASLISGGSKAGLSKDAARTLALQTLLGAAHILINANEDPASLTDKVTSKGGTTLAGLEILDQKGFTQTVEACILRASERAKELSAAFGA